MPPYPSRGAPCGCTATECLCILHQRNRACEDDYIFILSALSASVRNTRNQNRTCRSLRRIYIRRRNMSIPFAGVQSARPSHRKCTRSLPYRSRRILLAVREKDHLMIEVKEMVCCSGHAGPAGPIIQQISNKRALTYSALAVIRAVRCSSASCLATCSFL